MAAEQLLLVLDVPQLDVAELEDEIRDAERDYERALHHPRGEGLDTAGRRLHNLYVRRRGGGC